MTTQPPLFEGLAFDRSKGGNYLQIKLKGSQDNSFGIGSIIEVKTGSLTQTQHLQPSRGFQSSVDPTVFFGLADATAVDELRVRWPNGSYSILTDVSANQIVEIRQENVWEIKQQVANTPLFSDVTEDIGLQFRHREKTYDDFKKEILLPHKYSQLGPNLAVADVNGDGLEDFFIGGAAGFPGQLYLQTEQKNFSASSSSPWQQHKEFEDSGVLFFDCDGDGDQDFICCQWKQ